MSDFIRSLKKTIIQNIESDEWKKEFLYPMNKWIFTIIWPYALGIICFNFFLTIAAVSLVLYVFNRQRK